MSSDLNWLKRMLSHNMRMPMSIIAGYGELMRQGLLTEDEQKEAVTSICENIIYMNDLLKVVLQDEEGESEKSASEVVDLVVLIQRMIAYVQEVAKKSTISISFMAERTCMRIQAEHIAIMRMFYQLFENAFKYLGSGNTIFIQMYYVGAEQILVVFKDDGKGIPEKDMKRVFENGYRSLNSRGKHGSGYGLYDVKQTVERHGGTVKVFSRENNGFSVFLTFPAYQEKMEEGDA